MSVAFTVLQVRDRRKTVSRRVGWWVDRAGRRILMAGDQLTLVNKLPRSRAPIARLAEVEVVDVRREPLGLVAQPGELAAEGFPELESQPDGVDQFVARYFGPLGLTLRDDVTRIEWRYLT